MMRYEHRPGGRVVRCFTHRPASLVEMLHETAQRSPDKIALRHGEESLTYAALSARTLALAGSIQALGLERGQRIGILLDNSIDHVVALLGVAAAACVVVPVNAREPSESIAYLLGDARCTAVIYGAAHESRMPDRTVLTHLRHWIRAGDGDLPALSLADLASPERPWTTRTPCEDDIFALFYTSGSTGKPKGAVLDHCNIVHSILHFGVRYGFTANDRMILSVPLSHIMGLVGVVATMIRVGGETIIQTSFSAQNFLAEAAERRMTATLLTPAQYALCLLRQAAYPVDLPAWTLAIYGGAPMPVGTIAGLAAAWPEVHLSNGYGATETATAICMVPRGDEAAGGSSAGPVVPCGDLRIMDEHGREVPEGETGELWISGPMVAREYWERPEATAEAFIGGYWRSGDLAHVDKDGLVHIVDRKKDMIIRGGYKVFSSELEMVLNLAPGVNEIAAVGHPCPVLGERTHVFVHGDPAKVSLDKLRAFAGQRLADYKLPDFLTMLDAPLPRNANGKILKAVLKAALEIDGTEPPPMATAKG